MQAEKVGVDARPAGHAVLQQARPGRASLHHFTEVARATDLPVMLYDVPGRTGQRDRAGDLRGGGAAGHGRPRQGRHRRPARHDRAARARLRRLLRRRRAATSATSPTAAAASSRWSATWPATSCAEVIDAVRRRRPGGRAGHVHRGCCRVIDAVMGVPNYGATTAKAALQLLGVLDNRTRPRPAGPARRRRGRRACAPPSKKRASCEPSAPRAVRPARAAQGRPAGHPARRPRRGRPQHDRLRVRRPPADRRLRGALPRGEPPGRRPDPARLRRDPGPPRRRRGAGADPRPRGPHRRGAVPAARARRHPAGRLAAHPGAARLQAARAPAQGHRASTIVAEGDRLSFGPFDLEFVAVNHSIPDALAVAIRTGAGMVLHTGDFKMDQLPLDGRITDLRAFARLGEEGVDLFLTDSTNAEVPGLHDLREGDRAGPRPGLPHQPDSGSSWPASPPTCTACSR